MNLPLRPLSLGLCLVLVSCSAEPRFERRPLLAVVDATLIDGTGSSPVEGAVVLIRDGRFEAVGPGSGISVPPDAEVIHAAGGTVLPGLFDAHVHVASALRRDRGAATAWLRGGVTTLVDMGTTLGPHGLRQELEAVSGPAPRLLVAGPILTAPGGYPFAGAHSSALGIANDARGVREIEDLARSGIDHVKLALERGFDADVEDEDWPIPTAEVLDAVAETAHRHKLRVSVHLTQSGELEAALEAGMDNAAHTPVDPIPDAVLTAAAQADFVLVSTAGLWRETPELLQGVLSNLRRYLEHGGRVALGTDAPGFGEPGLPLAEMQLLLEAGLSPMQIITAASRDAAFAFGRDGDLGTIEPGKTADLVVVAGDPIEDIRRLQEVSVVIRAGCPVLLGGEIQAQLCSSAGSTR